MIRIFSIFLISLLFVSCADKKKFGKSDEEWYKDLLKQIDYNNLDKADDVFSSLEAEHFRSPLIKTATKIMIQAHTKQENHLLANYYINKFEQRFGTKENIDYLQYLRIKSQYMAFRNPKRDQKLINKTLDMIENYLFDFSDSQYVPYVKTMQTNLTLSRYYLRLDIMKLYERLDKPKAVEYYRNKEDMSWFENNIDEFEEPSLFLVRYLFE
jgi:outer membrane protein assembly factor BamD